MRIKNHSEAMTQMARYILSGLPGSWMFCKSPHRQKLQVVVYLYALQHGSLHAKIFATNNSWIARAANIFDTSHRNIVSITAHATRIKLVSTEMTK
jgi:hypothetical protein